MKQAVFICDIPQFSPNVVQKLFKIDPENFENLGVKFENVEFLLVSAANRGKRIQEVDELTTFFLQQEIDTGNIIFQEKITIGLVAMNYCKIKIFKLSVSLRR